MALVGALSASAGSVYIPVTGSLVLIGESTTFITGSTLVTGSMIITGSLITSGSTTITGSTLITGSMIITGSLTVTGSDTFTVHGPSIFNGNIESSGFVTASMGLSGSLTRLVNGTSYLAAGDNVTITSSSNGQVVINSTGGSPGGSTTELQYNNGGVFDGVDAFQSDGTNITLLDAGQLRIGTGTDLVISSSNDQVYFGLSTTNKDLIFTSIEEEIMRIDESHNSVAIGINANTVAKLLVDVEDEEDDHGIKIQQADSTNSKRALWIDSAAAGIYMTAKDGIQVVVDEDNGYGFLTSRNKATVDAPLVKIRDQQGDQSALKVIQESADTSAFGIEIGNVSDTKTTLSGSGQVGIGKGTTAYDAMLHVKGISRGDGIVLEDASSTDIVVKMYESTDDGVIDIYANNSVTARIHGNGDSYLGGGNVGIGTSTPAVKFDVVGNARVTGSLKVTEGISGSLTKLNDGASYLIAGSNIAVTSASNGSVTIASTGTDTTYTAGDGLDLSGTTFSTDLKSGGGLRINSTELEIDNSVVATLSGSAFSGHVGVTGSIHATAEISGSILKGLALSGSLTRLEDGTSYLVAGTNVTIASASNGQVTISSTGGSGTPAGADTQIQYNNDGAFGAIAAFTWDDINLKIDSATRLQFRDSDIYIESPADGKLNISSDSKVLILSGGDGTSFDEASASDVNFYVSGSADQGRRPPADTAVFGGDLVVSGGLTVFYSGSQYAGGGTISGSIHETALGASYLVAGSNVTIASASNGQVTISSTGGGSIDGSGAATRIAYWSDADTLTSDADLVFDGDTLTAANSSNTAIPAIKIDRDYDGTTSVGNYTTDPQGLLVDYDVTGIVASGQTQVHDAIAINFNQDAPTHVGTLNSTGLDLRMTGGTSGAQTMKGVAVVLAGADTNIGLDVQVPDGQDHLMLRSSADIGDYFAISTTTHGATTIKTNDNAGGDDADLTLDVDGKIIIQAKDGDETVFNESAADVNFRVESTDIQGMIVADAGTNQLLLHTSGTSATTAGAAAGTDVAIYLSGAIGSKNISNSKGASVFTGDLVVSGGLSVGTGSVGLQTLNVYGNVSGDFVAKIDNDQASSGHVLKLLTDGNGSLSRLLEMEDGDGDILFRARADGRFGFGPTGVSSMGAGTFVVGIDGGHTADIAISKRLQHLGDSNTYIDFPADDQIQLVAGAVDMINMLEDSGNGQVLILSGGGPTSTDESDYADLSFFVSGSIGSKDTTIKGTSVFGGDLVVSGALLVKNGTISGGSISGSIHETALGASYLVAGSNVTIVSASNGQVTISSTGGGGGGISWDGSTANGIATFKDADEATVEANFTFDGSNGRIASTGRLEFNNANTFINSSTPDMLDVFASTDLNLSSSATKVISDLPNWTMGMPVAGVGAGLTLRQLGTGTSMTAGAVYYLSGSGTWTAAQASHVLSGSMNFMAVAGTPEIEGDMFVNGPVNVAAAQFDGGVPTLSGSALYLSKNTAGSFTVTAPTGSGEIVKVLGHCIGIDRTQALVWFNPECGWIELS